MEASALSPAHAVHITPQTLALGNYQFDTERVQAVRVWTLRPTRALWLLLLFGAAATIHLISGGFEDGEFRWSNMFDWMGIVLAVLLVIMVALAIRGLLAKESSPVYILQLKTDRGSTSAWATLDQTKAGDVAVSIKRAAQGEDVHLNLGSEFRREGKVLHFGDGLYPLLQVKSATSARRQADLVADLADILIGAFVLSFALNSLVGNMTNYDPSRQWLRDILMVASILFMIPGFALRIVWSVERKTRYVHVVSLKLPSGQTDVYATLDQAEADALIASINNAVAANPSL